MYPNPTHLLVPWYLPSVFATSPPTGKKNMEAVVCHTVYPFVHPFLPANVHCIESLVWFRVFGFCYIINTGFSPGLLSDILFFALCCGDLGAFDLQDQPIGLYFFKHTIMRVLKPFNLTYTH